MSWVLEAIEREALIRAREELSSGFVTIMGMDTPRVAALRGFFIETTGLDPSQVSANEIFSRLRERRK